MAVKQGVMMRDDELAYMKVGTAWELINRGFTALGENPSAQVETSQYIADRNSTKDTTGYETVLPFTMEFIPEDPANAEVHMIATRHMTGHDAVREIALVETWNEISPGIYSGRTCKASVEISSNPGTAGQKITFSGNFNLQGNFTEVEWDKATKTPTPKAAG